MNSSHVTHYRAGRSAFTFHYIETFRFFIGFRQNTPSGRACIGSGSTGWSFSRASRWAECRELIITYCRVLLLYLIVLILFAA